MCENERAKVIIDTNFLFIPLRFNVDIFEELERIIGRTPKCIVPSVVVEELKDLRRRASPHLIQEIDFALSLVDKCEKMEFCLGTAKSTDEVLIELAKRINCPVATNDSELRKRLRSLSVSVIYLRQRAYLEIDGLIY